jgi:hypothetical protein
MGKLFFPSIVVVMGLTSLPWVCCFIFLLNELFFHLCPKKRGKKIRANGLLIDE